MLENCLAHWQGKQATLLYRWLTVCTVDRWWGWVVVIDLQLLEHEVFCLVVVEKNGSVVVLYYSSFEP